MLQLLRNFLSHPFGAAFAGGLIPGVLSIVCVVMTYNYGVDLQRKQSRLDQIVRFDQSSTQVVEAGGQMIATLNQGKDLASPKQSISALVAKQLMEAHELKRFFPANKEVGFYEEAIIDFNKTSKSMKSVEDIKAFGESFGRVIDARDGLTKSLFKEIGSVS